VAKSAEELPIVPDPPAEFIGRVAGGLLLINRVGVEKLGL